MYSYSMPDVFSRLYISFCGSFSNLDSFPMQYVTNSNVFLSIIHSLVKLLQCVHLALLEQLYCLFLSHWRIMLLKCQKCVLIV